MLRRFISLLLATLLTGVGGWLVPFAMATTTYNDLTITNAQVWTKQDVRIDGKLSIAPGGSLSLVDSTLLFDAVNEGDETFTMSGNAAFSAKNSTVASGSGKQWNLKAYDSSSLSFDSTAVRDDTGMRLFDSSSLTATASNVAEVQVHNSASVSLNNGSTAFLGLYFTGSGAVNLISGELAAGGVTARAFAFPTGSGTGNVSVVNSTITGFQADLSDQVSLTVSGAVGLIPGIHLNNVSKTVGGNLTSSLLSTGSIDFTDKGGPALIYKNSQVPSLNVYLTGTSNVSFTGTLDMTEPYAQDESVLTLGSGVSLLADVAQTRDSAKLILNGTTLLERNGQYPSFTAFDDSTITLNNVNATPSTQVYTEGDGKVRINGGTGW